VIQREVKCKDWAFIVVSAIVNDLRNPQVGIFLSYIFLSAKPKQENVGEENKSGSFLQSSADGRNDSQSRRLILNRVLIVGSGAR
jgi:hypothetical protein